MDLGDAVGAVGADDREVCHADPLLGPLGNEAHARHTALVARIPSADVRQELAVDLVDDFEIARDQESRRAGPARSPGPRASACDWCRRGFAG